MTAATVCVSSGGWLNAGVEIVLWESPDEARAALTELLDVRCSRKCRGRHLVVVRDGDVWEVTFPGLPGPASLAEQLDALYPRKWANRPPERWPTPSILNLPLGRPAPPSRLRSQMRNGERLALQRGLATVAT